MSKIIAIVNDRHNKQHLYNKYNIVDSLQTLLSTHTFALQSEHISTD